MNMAAVLISRFHELQPAADAMLLACAEAGLAVARDTCPVDTGRLRDSCRMEKMAGDDEGYTVMSGGQDAPSAPFVCFGTTNLNYPVNNYMERGRQAAIAKAQELMKGGYGGW